jgi:hypothetical protein
MTTSTTSRKGQYRTADGRAQIEWELEEKEPGRLTFSACATSYRPKGGGHCGGQCIDEIARDYPADTMVQRIARVWAVWHLNDMKAGTHEQEAALKKAAADSEPWRSEQWKGDHYAWACHVLKEAGLYEVPATPELRKAALGGFSGEVYRYGERWLHEPLPADVVAEVESWSTNAAESLEASLAQRFLDKHGLKMRLTRSDSKPAPWDGPSGHHYRVTIYRPGRGKSPFGRLAFDFWDSAANAESGADLAPESVLSAVASDLNCPATFADWCGEYGESEDSIKARQTFNRCRRFADRLRAFFSSEERAELEELS